jgi:hypothetical protein
VYSPPCNSCFTTSLGTRDADALAFPTAAEVATARVLAKPAFSSPRFFSSMGSRLRLQYESVFSFGWKIIIRSELHWSKLNQLEIHTSSSLTYLEMHFLSI